MIIFRPCKGNLNQEMAEAKEFDSVDEMKKYIVEQWHKAWNGSKKMFSVEDVMISDETTENDQRIGWEDSKYVCSNRMGDENYMELYGRPQFLGMCATRYRLQN